MLATMPFFWIPYWSNQPLYSNGRTDLYRYMASSNSQGRGRYGTNCKSPKCASYSSRQPPESYADTLSERAANQYQRQQNIQQPNMLQSHQSAYTALDMSNLASTLPTASREAPQSQAVCYLRLHNANVLLIILSPIIPHISISKWTSRTLSPLNKPFSHPVRCLIWPIRTSSSTTPMSTTRPLAKETLFNKLARTQPRQLTH